MLCVHLHSCVFSYLFCLGFTYPCLVLSLVVVCVFSRHFGQISSVFFVLIPELFFMVCLFGYLVFMVVFKWIAYTPAQSKIAPSILIHFIDMFLFTDNPENPKLYEGQVCGLLISLKETDQCFKSCSTIYAIVFYSDECIFLCSWKPFVIFYFLSTVWKSPRRWVKLGWDMEPITANI